MPQYGGKPVRGLDTYFKWMLRGGVVNTLGDLVSYVWSPPSACPQIIADEGFCEVYDWYCVRTWPSDACGTYIRIAAIRGVERWIRYHISLVEAALPDWLVNLRGQIEGLFAHPFGTVLGWLGVTPDEWTRFWDHPFTTILGWLGVDTSRWTSFWNYPFNTILGWLGVDTDKWRDFWDHPFTTILGWLGVGTEKWTDFWADPLGYILAIWGLSRQDVYDFFDHPILWWIDRFNERLGRSGEGIAWEFLKLVGTIIGRGWEL